MTNKNIAFGVIITAAMIGLLTTADAAEKCCVRPATEVATRNESYNTYGTSWNLTITGATFDGALIVEYDGSSIGPEYTGTDSCAAGLPTSSPYYINPNPSVSGGEWPVGPDNDFGPDNNALSNSPSIVQYYQQLYGPAINCGVTLYQGMRLECGMYAYVTYTQRSDASFDPNVLTMMLTATEEVNGRKEFSGQNVWSEEPSGQVTQ